MSRHFAIGFLGCLLLAPLTSAAEEGASIGVVCNVKVLSDRVPDVSSMEAWQRSFIKPGMSDRDKALAACARVAEGYVYRMNRSVPASGRRATGPTRACTSTAKLAFPAV